MREQQLSKADLLKRFEQLNQEKRALLSATGCEVVVAGDTGQIVTVKHQYKRIKDR